MRLEDVLLLDKLGFGFFKNSFHVNALSMSSMPTSKRLNITGATLTPAITDVFLLLQMVFTPNQLETHLTDPYPAQRFHFWKIIIIKHLG